MPVDKNDQAKTAVVNVLRSSDIFVIKPFIIGAHYFHPLMLNLMSINVAIGIVQVRFDPTLNEGAKYNTNNKLSVGFTSAHGVARKALIVHEATHAVFDMLEATMIIAEIESIAHLVQFQYLRARSLKHRTRPKDTNDAKDKLYKVAWDLAGTLLSGKTPTQKEYLDLQDAVSKHPDYASIATIKVNFDGIY